MKNKNKLIILIICLLIIFLGVVFVGIPLYKKAVLIGEEAGAAVGNAVGTAIGSYEGITQDFPDGFNAGKEEGLSAKDTQVDMQNALTEVNRLEVLVTSFKVNNYHQFSDRYAALYLMKAEAVFTVDLSEAVVTSSDDGMTIFIYLPVPDVTVYIDESKTEKAWDEQRKWFDGNAEDGFDAYINSLDQIEEKAQESIASDDNMMNCAIESAKRQVAQIASNTCVNGENVIVFCDR